MEALTLPRHFENEIREFKQAWDIHVRVVGALVLREVKTRFWQNPMGYFWAIFDPCLHMAVWFFIMMYLRGGDSKAPIHGVGPILFLASGILPYDLFIKVAKYISKAVSANVVFMDYPLVKYIDVIFARFIVAGCTEMIVDIAILVVLILCGAALCPDNYLGLFSPCALLLLLGFGWGSVNAVYGYVSILWRDLAGIVQRFLYFSSGVFFLADQLPTDLRYWMSWNPAFNGIELFRSAYFANYKSACASSAYIFFWGIGLSIFGLLSQRALQGRLKES